MPKKPLAWLEKETWITKDGRELLPSEMDTDHLRNTLKFLESRAERLLLISGLYLCSLPGPRGDHAQDAYMGEIGRLADADALEWLKGQRIYQALSDELARRR